MVRNGFTLVELLVVVGIIGVLVSVSAVSFLSIRAKARDAKRVSDVRVLSAAFDEYEVSNSRFALAGCGEGSPTQQCDIPADFPNQKFKSISDPLGKTACGRGVQIPCQFSIGVPNPTVAEYEICFGTEAGVASIGPAGIYKITPGGQISSGCSYQPQPQP